MYCSLQCSYSLIHRNMCPCDTIIAHIVTRTGAIDSILLMTSPTMPQYFFNSETRAVSWVHPNQMQDASKRPLDKPPWVPTKDKKTGKTYYFHRYTFLALDASSHDCIKTLTHMCAYVCVRACVCVCLYICIYIYIYIYIYIHARLK